MAGLPVFRISKLKAYGASTPTTAMAHLTRSRETPNADASRRHLNRWLVGSPDLDLLEAVKLRLDAAGITVRPTATIAVELLVTASAELFRPDQSMGFGEADPEILKCFENAAMHFLTETCGDKLLAAVLHCDEATPHVHAVMVPLLPPRKRATMRLSAKDYFDPPELRRMQTLWQGLLAPLGCEPRLEGSPAHHLSNARYHATIREIEAQVDGFVWKLRPSPPPSPDRAANARALQSWYETQIEMIREQIRPLAQAAVYGRMYDGQRRNERQLRERLDLAKARLREAAVETQRRLDLKIQRKDIEFGFGWVLDDGPVLDQICRREGIGFWQASELVASKVGTEAALAALCETLRPRLESARRRAAEVAEQSDARYGI